jgi:hypothetical protein
MSIVAPGLRSTAGMVARGLQNVKPGQLTGALGATVMRERDCHASRAFSASRYGRWRATLPSCSPVSIMRRGRAGDPSQKAAGVALEMLPRLATFAPAW